MNQLRRFSTTPSPGIDVDKSASHQQSAQQRQANSWFSLVQTLLAAPWGALGAGGWASSGGGFWVGNGEAMQTDAQSVLKNKSAEETFHCAPTCSGRLESEEERLTNVKASLSKIIPIP
jgi:hypothetical protein